MAIRKAEFSNGGFVLHKIAGAHKGVCSAWFDKDGCLLDAEQLRSLNEYPRAVARGGPLWCRLAKLGPVWKGPF